MLSQKLLHTCKLVLHEIFTNFRHFSTTNIANKLLSLWYKRLGHAPLLKLRYIASVIKSTNCQEVCLTCLIAKFVKLPYDLSEHRAAELCDLIHIDRWGAYRVLTHGKFGYFLTIVDDQTRATKVYLLQSKSQAFTMIHLRQESLWKTNQNPKVKQCLRIWLKPLSSMLCLPWDSA